MGAKPLAAVLARLFHFAARCSSVVRFTVGCNGAGLGPERSRSTGGN